MFKAVFKIEHWYHVFIVLGCIGAITSLVIEFKGIANAHAALLFFGIFFIGIGEWINHPLQTKIVRPNAFTPGGGIITGHPRQNVFLGIFFDVVGVGLVAVGIYKIANA